MGFLGNFVAPATLVAGLLFYFGYVSSRAYFSYFGIDVDLLRLSNQGFVMRSPGALLLPAIVVLSLSALLVLGHRVLRRWTSSSGERARSVAVVFGAVGAVLLFTGLVFAGMYGALRSWDASSFLTPLLLTAGAGFCAYAAAMSRSSRAERGGLGVVVLFVLVVAAGAFWTTATVAQSWGLGEARSQAADLSSLPAVVLDTRERLAPGNADITVQSLDEASAPVDAESGTQTYRYRYYGLRLLVEGGGRLYLVPDRWSADASTLVIPFDDSVRLRFRFFPDENPPV
ncbi:hypothetical protein ACFM35_06195 [Microbacterium sp. P01]|uniref:hypothetical protein n=1 Tax=Microbacterium sp. P01 TaxID=3366261 RepID=UPI0036703581